jgi:hypothetical protein
MKRLATALLTLLLGLPVLAEEPAVPIADQGNPSTAGIVGGTATDRTLRILEQLPYPIGIPDDISVFYVSSEEGGWFPEGSSKGIGTLTEPYHDLDQVRKLIDYGKEPMLFLFDPGDTFEPPGAYGFFKEPQNGGGCGGTGEVCWIFASADASGREMPTFDCLEGVTSATGHVENSTSDVVAFANVRFHCLDTGDENLDPVFYNNGKLILVNVHVNDLVATGNTFLRAIAGSQTIGVNVSGITMNGHALDQICVAADDPVDCCTAALKCDGSNPLFFEIEGGNHVFIGGSFLYNQEHDSSQVPTVSFGDASGTSVTRFFGTSFRYANLNVSTSQTLKRAWLLSDDAKLTFTHGTITTDDDTADNNTNSAFYFEASDATQDVDLRFFRYVLNGLDRVWEFPTLLTGADDDVYGRCIATDELDVSKDGINYEVFAVGTFGAAAVDFDVHGMFDDDEGTTAAYSWKGTTYNDIDDFRTAASANITSWFENAEDTTVGSAGSRDCAGAADQICYIPIHRQSGACGHTDCDERCDVIFTETLPFTVGPFLLGDGGSFNSWRFNAGQDQNFGGVR